MPDIDNNQLAISNLLTVNELVFHALDCDKEKAYLNVIGRLAIGSRGYELVNKITNRIEIKNSGDEGQACAILLGEKYSPSEKIVTPETAKFSVPTYMKVLDEILLNEELPFPKNILDSNVTYRKYTKLSWLFFFVVITLTLTASLGLLTYIESSDLPQHPMFWNFILFAGILAASVLLLFCKKQMNTAWNLKKSKKTFTCERDRKTIQALIVSTSKQKDSWSLAAQEVIEIATKGVESLPYNGNLDQIFEELKVRKEKIEQLKKLAADLTGTGHALLVVSVELNRALLAKLHTTDKERAQYDKVYKLLISIIDGLNEKIRITQKSNSKGPREIKGTQNSFYNLVEKEHNLFKDCFSLNKADIYKVIDQQLQISPEGK